jgi:Putative lumazine-binding
MRTIRAYHRLAGTLASAAVLAIGLGACGTAISTGKYKGESKAVVQRIADFQTDVTASEEKKLCANDLAHAVQARLQAAGGDCVQALKKQLGAIQNFELTVKSIAVRGASATARVSSTWSGKQRTSTMRLVKEGGAWKIAALQ